MGTELSSDVQSCLALIIDKVSIRAMRDQSCNCFSMTLPDSQM
jgi:hypothetical protein